MADKPRAAAAAAAAPLESQKDHKQAPVQGQVSTSEPMVDAMTDDVKMLSISSADGADKLNSEGTPAQRARIAELAAVFKRSEPTVAQLEELGMMMASRSGAPIDPVYREGLIPVFTRFLGHAQLSRSAAFCLANVTGGSSEVQRTVLKSGALMPLLMLMSGDGASKINAIWAFANLLGDEHVRDLITESGLARTAVLDLFKQKLGEQARRPAAWALGNLVRVKSMAQDETVQALVLNLLEAETDPEALLPRIRRRDVQQDVYRQRVGQEGAAAVR
jgi:hypothetical protein